MSDLNAVLPAPHAWPSPKAALELLKPLTWFAPMWALGCGVISSGMPLAGRWPLIVGAVVLAGPMVCGTSQAVNDWFDRHVDAINEPNRPIPSGRIPGRWGLYIALLWTVLSLALASALGPWIFGAGALGVALAWAYSAPPLRLKANGWFGNSAVGLCYEGVPWFTGAAAMTALRPGVEIIALALLYSAGAFGIMILNDFKSVEGDRALGLRSLPVQVGVEPAAVLASYLMGLPQVLVVALLLRWERPVHAAIVAALLLLQVACMVRMVRRPLERAAWYNATGTTLYVLGMLASALAVRSVGHGGV